MPWFHRIASLLLVSILTACSTPSVPKEQYYRLIATLPTTPFSHPLDGAIEVPPFTAEGVLAERPLLFTANGGRKLEQRNYAYWTEVPQEMLRGQVIAYLNAAEAAPEIAPTELRITAQYQLRGSLRRLEQIVGTNPGATIALDLAVIENKTGKRVLSRTYSIEKNGASEKIDDSVALMNEGLDEILVNFANELQAIP